MPTYEYDKQFLELLDRAKVKTKYAKIILLDFQEKPIKSIEGTFTQGSVNVNGSAAIRRTISLTMLASPQTSNIENLDNEIALDKKVKVEIGYDNPFPEYQHYGDIIWFKCGLYILTSANTSRSTSGFTITIQGKDKMAQLDGTSGGVLPAAVSFHERYNYPNVEQMHLPPEQRDVIIEHPTIHQIIFEAVHHYGKEDPAKIIIADIDEQAKLLVKYIGDEPIYFDDEFSSCTLNPTFASNNDYKNMFVYSQDVGYFPTDFTYPGELNLKPGETVVSLLTKIQQTLGNHEFFYDLDGNFVFQEKKNYLNSGINIKELSLDNYVQLYGDDNNKYIITDFETVSSINRNPKFDNIKNDFIVWGQRTTEAGSKIDIWYHLAIDQKPAPNYVLKYVYSYTITDNITGIPQVRYEFLETEEERDLPNWELLYNPVSEDNWREELYRRALEASSVGDKYSDYDQELLAYWRHIFDPANENWKDWEGWNPIVENDPRQLNYWLDFIDESAAIGQYSVNMIGRRTKVVNDTKIKVIYNKEVPDVIFVPVGEEIDKDSFEAGQKIFQIDKKLEELFITSSSGTSAFDKIRELLYQHLNYNTQITIQTVPKYYLEPNNIIHLEDPESNISGDFLITQYTLPLAYQGMMSITAQQVLNRV